MALYATVEDVATEVGRPINPPEDSQVLAWIDRVEGRILGRIPNLAELVAESSYLAQLKGVIVDVVARKVRNPEGMRSERIDDYYYDRGGQTADLWPTDSEWAELIPDAMRGAFSVRPSFIPDRGCEPWL